jgi:hypothetical protein
MKFWNDYDFDHYALRMRADTPNIIRGFQILNRVKADADTNSDGWAYWPAPVNASRALMALLEKRVEPTEKALTRAIAPIRGFYTRTQRKVPTYPDFPEL